MNLQNPGSFLVRTLTCFLAIQTTLPGNKQLTRIKDEIITQPGHGAWLRRKARALLSDSTREVKATEAAKTRFPDHAVSSAKSSSPR